MNRKLILLGACAAIAAYVVLQIAPTGGTPAAQAPENKAIVSIQMPDIQGNAVIGEKVFQNACISCHGPNGTGVDGAGPPLIHKIYEPGHHADEAFQRAVANGVRSHHWSFGDMPPIEGLTRGDVKMVLAYIRTIQRANGIN
ncbi:cytochrome c [uncultured Shimia sp.]|uniref:c-type cytochrome n=1 Tax=uncultured Shimia sp. TaxID=573152 RepID=UPI002630DB30|nr:cytochrome c [uncultured Shimia sp.]